MGAAIINEILKPTFNNSFIEPFKKNPLDTIYNPIYNLLIKINFSK